MSINEKEIMILIKDNIKTNEIDTIYFDELISKYRIIYKKNTKEYIVNKENVIIINNPTKLDLNLYKFKTKNGKELFNIKEAYLFTKEKKYYYIAFNNGTTLSYSDDMIDVKESLLLNVEAKEKIEYLKCISKINDLRNEDTDEKILEKRMNKINFFDDTVLKTYLNQKELEKEPANIFIFPFGCNNSQYKAVANAMQNDISVIEGPPGTGKTQTILNIISNILVSGKNVQVVSNNNSAIENILEKMEKQSLDWIIAKLGKKENKDNFVTNQSGKYPNIEDWNNTHIEENYNEIKNKNIKLKLFYAANEKKSYLLELLDEFKHEKEYFIKYMQENNTNVSFVEKKKIKSDRILKLLLNIEKRKKFGLLARIKCYIYGVISINQFNKMAINDIIVILQYLFITLKIDEIKTEIDRNNIVINENMNIQQEVIELSIAILRKHLYDKYNTKKERIMFTEKELSSNVFLDEYPIVLSTTFSSSENIKNVLFDYLIIDEASQVDIATGALALSTAKKAIIVGDMKQLPNVIDTKTRSYADKILKDMTIPKGLEYDISFLQSVVNVLPEIPRVLLSEHYRCHPKIIGFCNKEFYNSKLLIMTEDKNETDVLKCIKTVKGNHETDKINYRELDVIKDEILPELNHLDNIGIITPYNNQVNIIKKYLENAPSIENVEVGTIHKFQGRDKDIIIISTVDNNRTGFIDDNMLNVAISRAKKKLYLVTTGNDGGVGKNVNDFIDYINYNNFEVTDSRIRSVFDCLYKQYDSLRKDIISKIKIISEYDSENIMYNVILDVLNEKYQKYNVTFNYPMNALIKDYSLLSDKNELLYATNPFTHIDFLIFSKVTKMPVLAIEVDGYTFHKVGTLQYERDIIKNHILDIYNIPLVRFSTKESRIKEKLISKMKEVDKV